MNIYANPEKLRELKDKANRLPLEPGVYIMKNSQGEIIYIGSTSNFEGRKYQHLTAIENKKTDKKLYKYCADNNISYRDVKIDPIITEAELSRFNVENLIINLLNPIGNCESIKN